VAWGLHVVQRQLRPSSDSGSSWQAAHRVTATRYRLRRRQPLPRAPLPRQGRRLPHRNHRRPPRATHSRARRWTQPALSYLMRRRCTTTTPTSAQTRTTGRPTLRHARLTSTASRAASSIRRAVNSTPSQSHTSQPTAQTGCRARSLRNRAPPTASRARRTSGTNQVVVASTSSWTSTGSSRSRSRSSKRGTRPASSRA